MSRFGTVSNSETEYIIKDSISKYKKKETENVWKIFQEF